jgi:hypothetical protein
MAQSKKRGLRTKITKCPKSGFMRYGGVSRGEKEDVPIIYSDIPVRGGTEDITLVNSTVSLKYPSTQKFYVNSQFKK